MLFPGYLRANVRFEYFRPMQSKELHLSIIFWKFEVHTTRMCLAVAIRKLQKEPPRTSHKRRGSPFSLTDFKGCRLRDECREVGDDARIPRIGQCWLTWAVSRDRCIIFASFSLSEACSSGRIWWSLNGPLIRQSKLQSLPNFQGLLQGLRSI